MSNTVHKKGIIGNPQGSFWLYDSVTGFDLTHPATITSSTTSKAVQIKTTKEAITVDPAKSALVIIDMQNFFLSPSLGNSPKSKGLVAQQQLLRYAIPAARKMNMQIIWLNWGLTQVEVDTMPPATHKTFGFRSFEVHEFEDICQAGADTISDTARSSIPDPTSVTVETLGKNPRKYKGLGQPLGEVTLVDGQVVSAGRMLMRDQWNTQMTVELTKAYLEGLQLQFRPDVWIHKNRMSGLWGNGTPCTDFLEQQGIQTLFFAGVNTDQCVSGSLTDAFSKGYDCVLLSDGCGTTSPSSSQDCIEFNAASTYGFLTSCKDLWDAVD